MKSQWLRFFLIISILFFYTGYQFSKILPEHQLLAFILPLPLFLLMLGWQLIHRNIDNVFNKLWFVILAWAGTLTIGFWSTYMFFCILVDIVGLIVPVSTIVHLWIFIFCCVTTILGLISVLRGPKVVEISANILNSNANDPQSAKIQNLNGLKIAQLSDIHIGPTIRLKYVQDMVTRTNALSPDFIFITGDIADAKAEEIQEYMEPLRELKAKYGVFYITGNHEFYWGMHSLVEAIRKMGIVPLLNENKIVNVNGVKVMIAGVTDPAGAMLGSQMAPDIVKAHASIESVDYKILLAHRPGDCFQAEPLGFNLQFSGHTHSGQYFPFNLLIGFFHKYYRGLNKHRNMWVYVNPGTGYWGPANRLGVRAEITLMSLQTQN